ncbi:MAG: Gfo/Idh/MocA family oxidoreductase [Kiritimatiellae bacterium]|nr:Gfo/Idh/MocA family oxidoreductase [Kiritimatiellia bacterium]
MKNLKIGLLGAGQVAFGNCRDIRQHPQAEVIAVADPSLKRAKALQNEYGISRVYESADALYADKDIDAVGISVPNAYHASTAIGALRAGKHVLLDKPFALSRREALDVVRTAKKARKLLVLGMNQRFAPSSQVVKALVERGTLGDIYHGKAYWLRRTGIPRMGTWFCRKEIAGGGVTLDIGVHALDLCLYLMDNFKADTVSAVTHSVFGPRGLGEGGWGMSDRAERIFDVEDFSSALIRMKNGATVVLEVSWALHQESAGRHNVELFGTEAGASVFPAAKVFRFGKRKGEYDVVEPQGVRGPCHGQTRFANWIDAILGKCKPCTTMAQALAVQTILDAVYTSAASGKEVRLRAG